METKTITCICCPMGCQLSVTYQPGDRESVTVTGNGCPRGPLYAKDEVTNPTRVVTGTIRLSNREGRVVSVKTKDPVSKEKIMAIANRMKELSVQAPVRIGDVAEEDICGSGVQLVITCNID